jgi:hypothetical protein
MTDAREIILQKFFRNDRELGRTGQRVEKTLSNCDELALGGAFFHSSGAQRRGRNTKKEKEIPFSLVLPLAIRSRLYRKIFSNSSNSNSLFRCNAIHGTNFRQNILEGAGLILPN